jgi:hypothetical protein
MVRERACGRLERGTRLQSFLRGEDPAAAVRSLPERAHQVFLRLCRVEEADRHTFFFPGSDDQLAVLAERGLIEFEGTRLHVDPGALQVGRETTDPEFARSVDAEMSANWTASMMIARDNGQTAEVVRFALNAAPYLIRLERWDQLGWVCEAALAADTSPATAALLLPFVETAAEGSGEPAHRALHARVLVEVDRERGVALSREQLAKAVEAGNFRLAAVTARELSEVLRNEGRLDEALTLARQAGEHTAAAGLGPWSRALAKVRELQVLSAHGDLQPVLDEAQRLLAELPETSADNEITTHSYVHESLLVLGSDAAGAVGDHATGLRLAEQLVAALTSRNVPSAELAKGRYVLAGRWVEAGRDDEAREVLLWCQRVWSEHDSAGLLRSVIHTLAAIEDRAGNRSRALELMSGLLRSAYETGDVAEIGRGHHDLAVLIGRVDSASQQVLANYLASALIAARTNADTLSAEIGSMAMFAFAHGLPGQIALDEMVALAERTKGVRLGELLERLPPQVPDELQQLFDHVLQQAGQAMEDWKPLMLAMVFVATGTGQPGWEEQLEPELAGLEQRPDTAPMARALRRILAGERGADLADGLGLLPTGIVLKVLEGISLQAREGS